MLSEDEVKNKYLLDKFGFGIKVLFFYFHPPDHSVADHETNYLVEKIGFTYLLMLSQFLICRATYFLRT